MDDDLNFGLEKDESTKRESKYNIFQFQDELLRWISIKNNFFFLENYPKAFNGLNRLLRDSKHFFDDTEQKELEKMRESCFTGMEKHKVKLGNQQNGDVGITIELYNLLDKFEDKLMECLTNKNILLRMEKKGSEGAGNI